MSRKTRSGKPKGNDLASWAEAKRACRLSRRQVEMAQQLGMNPRKLPGLRPSPSQRWKLPVGRFIEQLHRERFGSHELDRELKLASSPSTAVFDRPRRRNDYRPEDGADALFRQAERLVCYTANLRDDLEAALHTRHVTPEMLADLASELRDIAQRLTEGKSVRQVSEVEAFAEIPRNDPPEDDDPDGSYDIPF